MDLSRIDHFAITVKDLQTSADWYSRVFGFEIIHRFTRTWMVGNETIKIGLMHRLDATPVDDLDNKIAFQHAAFLTDGDGLERAQIMLKDAGVAFDGPEDTGIAFSIFINDPDGHQLEITAYHPTS
jgi:catechol 2,3-dioxygenase-like lactoylglutathione lyase family enzyme